MRDASPLTYSSYLCLDRLLTLQQPQSEGPEHDEWLFITIHQVYELWFRQCLIELDRLEERLNAADTSGALATLRRLLTIFKTLVSQVDVLETMTPLQFKAFRSTLATSSGFQSAQFRELEFRLGLKRDGALAHHQADDAAHRRLQRAHAAPTLFDVFLRYLAGQGRPVPRSALERDVRLPLTVDPELVPLLIAVYREDGLQAQIAERLVDLDEGIQEWRYRHVKMVERTIGSRAGTGGSDGADYLRRTLFTPLFPDLWAIRSQL